MTAVNNTGERLQISSSHRRIFLAVAPHQREAVVQARLCDLSASEALFFGGSLAKVATDMDAAVGPIHERVPLDVIEVVLSHLHDVDTLRSLPSRTFKDLLAFLATLPEPSGFLRAVTVDGTTRDGQRRLELSIKEIAGALAQLPTATLDPSRVRSCIASHYGTEADSRCRDGQDSRLHHRDAVPFRHFLSQFGRIDSLVLKRVVVNLSPSPIRMTALPPVEVQLGSVSVSAVIGPSEVLVTMFVGFDAQATALSISVVPNSGRADRNGLRDLLIPFTLVHTLSVNVLSLTGTLKWFIEGHGNSPPPNLKHMVLQGWDRPDLTTFYSLHTLVLYHTTTSMVQGEFATLLYAGILETNWRLLSNAPTSLRHIELRFQRYGPHWRDTIDELWAIDDMEPSHVLWEVMDAGTLTRFPELESFTCVLCDGGFIEQWGPIKELSATPRSIHSRQVEFDDYIAFLRDVFPRLHAAGRLRFKMSDV
ncbi:hypothetical protein OH76DRAFT_1420265 [Lentinus brumalis]|uniref:Uncharacterized protein n=1 Tax=Lentinus brumalis TaxID=2498619 RepID=A0A371D1I0_9APHY|nr:hypothetical protein OH76DRAFT_1420265 [Polyporus brumalis]